VDEQVPELAGRLVGLLEAVAVVTVDDERGIAPGILV
jgi:hypothetical protein